MTDATTTSNAAASGAFKHWHYERDTDNIVWLACDKADASANVLSAAVLEELDVLLREIANTAPRGLIIYSAKKGGFIAGADINEFTTLTNEADATALIQRGQRVLDHLAELPFTTVAMIHGFCLGGGMELALACKYRVADDDDKTKLGLPEVNLGIHPGFGGTVRLPPLVGATDAMDLMLSGRTLSARNAKRIGLVDHAVPLRQLRVAAQQTVLKPPKLAQPKGWKAWTNHILVRPMLASYLRKQVAERARPDHYPAPYAIIDLWNRYADDPKTMMREEAASVARLVMGDTSRSLVRVFFLQERVKQLGRKPGYAPQHVHVIGGGVMGGDIAAWCALRGMKVTLQDRKPETIAKVIKRAHDLFSKRLKQPRLVQAAMDRLVPDIQGTGIPRADVVIEAIYENVEAKQALFRELEPKIRKDALLATNTSSIPLQTLSEALEHPERLVGLHFFNPVAKMQLVEIVCSEHTDPDVALTAAAFARHIDRLPVPVKSTPGFLVNRVLMPYLLEAVVMESEGVPAAAIDKAALDFGMPMGPIHLADTVGLDICLSVAEILSKHLGGEVPDRLRKLVAAGALGVKSGRGFYEYKDGKPVKPPVPEGTPIDDDVIDRMMFRLLNECVACLREGVVEDKELLDTGVIFGTGFAPFRGGPMNHIHRQGETKMHARLKQLAARYGARFNDDAGWGQLESSK